MSTRVRSWPKIASHFHALGVRCGHISVADVVDLRVCFLEISADVAAAKSEVIKFSLRCQQIFEKPTLKMRCRAATYGTERALVIS